MKSNHFELFLTVLDDKWLSVRWGRAGSETHGTVVKTLTLGDDVSVGITKDDEPVFVRLSNAIGTDKRFKNVFMLMKHGRPLSPRQYGMIVSCAAQTMNKVLKRYLAKKARDLA